MSRSQRSVIPSASPTAVHTHRHGRGRVLSVLVVVFFLSTVLGAYLIYTSRGVDSLRSEIYEPLQSEVRTIEGAALACTTRAPLVSTTYNALNASGAIGRIPRPLREQAAELYRESATLQREILDLTGRIQGAVSPRLK